MPGDYSRKIFNRKKHYSAVLTQQGRVQLDADNNEQVDLQQYKSQTTALDVIGNSGVPKKNGGFKISINQNNTDLIISSGRIYAGGLLFECEADGTTSYLHQPHLPLPDTTMFDGALTNGTYVVYMEGWQREINYIDDPQIQEVAIGEADTTTRLQNVWQVKLLKTNANAALSCESFIPEWPNLIAASTGKLNAQTSQSDDAIRPCMIPPKGGYTSLENQLYRIQIIKSGNESTASYSWSRDNASVETAIISISGSILTVADLGKDDVLGFSGGQWVEIVESEPTGAQPILFEINTVKPALQQIELKTSAIVFQNKKNLKLRRWDMQGGDFTNGIPLSTAWTNIETGIQVQFSAGTYRTGDYWLVPARVATADIEWPRDAGQNSLPQPPKGIERFYCRLALIHVVGQQISIEDCRPLFPALTEICAEDICYKNQSCSDSTATNVQQALDELCHKRDGACTYIAFPGIGWEKVFDKIGNGKDAQICFQVGDYPLTNEVLIKGKGHLKLSGAGAGTRILASGVEAALVFENCNSVLIRDLFAATSSFLKKPAKVTKNINGVITCINCATVKCEDLNLQCGSAPKKQVSCITIRNTAQLPGVVSIQNCHLEIGQFQQGILLVNASKSFIQNNRMSTYEVFKSVSRASLLNDKTYLSSARKALVSDAGVKDLKAREGMAVVTLNASGHTISFLSSNSVKNDWNRLLSQNPGSNIFSSKDLLKHVNKLADKIILDKNFSETINSFRALRKAIVLQTQAIASAGITISGTLADDVKIQSNNIEDCLSGIHIGLSHQAPRSVFDKAGFINIVGNNIEVVLSKDSGKLDRHGIFVGNVRGLNLEQNTILLQRLSGADFSVQGIKVWGVFGEKLMIQNNTICSKDGVKNNSFTNAIVVHPIIKKNNLQQWLVMYNLAIARSNALAISNGVVATNNTP